MDGYSSFCLDRKVKKCYRFATFNNRRSGNVRFEKAENSRLSSI